MPAHTHRAAEEGRKKVSGPGQAGQGEKSGRHSSRTKEEANQPEAGRGKMNLFFLEFGFILKAECVCADGGGGILSTRPHRKLAVKWEVKGEIGMLGKGRVGSPWSTPGSWRRLREAALGSMRPCWGTGGLCVLRELSLSSSVHQDTNHRL